MSDIVKSFMCRVSRRYRAAHCNHVDELPESVQIRMREKCRELDPRTWSDAKTMISDLLGDGSSSARSSVSGLSKAAAVFA